MWVFTMILTVELKSYYILIVLVDITEFKNISYIFIFPYVLLLLFINFHILCFEILHIQNILKKIK